MKSNSTKKKAKQDRQYWRKQTPQARLRAVELMRQIKYGKAALGPMERILEVVDRKDL